MSDNPLEWPILIIPDDSWEETDDTDSSSRLRLSTAFYINGHPLHLEAWAVRIGDDSVQVSDTDYPEDLDALSQISGGDGPFMTITIRGRQYVLVAYSFED